MARSKEDVLRLVSQIQKLMDPSNNATEGEMEAAAAAIQRLLKEHNLDIAEVEAAKGDEEEDRSFDIKDEHASEIRRTSLCGFQKILMSIVAGACECGVYFMKRYVDGKNGGRGTAFFVTFVGTDTDALIAKEMFDYLNKAIFKFGRQYFPKSNPEQTSFHFGCVSALSERVNKVEKDFEDEHKEYAMVLRDKKAAVRDYMDNQLDLRKGRGGGGRGTSGSHEAYMTGRDVGGKMDITGGRHLTNG